MSTRLLELTEHPGSVILHTQEILDEIQREFSEAASMEQRVGLLDLFHAVMNGAESALPEKNISQFREARMRFYKTLLVSEALDGTDVCQEKLLEVTTREVNAGRMDPQDSMHQLAMHGVPEESMGAAQPVVGASSNIFKRIAYYFFGGSRA
jgi:hypothetical protein